MLGKDNKGQEMNWIQIDYDMWIKLENVFHIWIDKTDNSFFAMGELIHNSEEIVLSPSFETFEECKNHIQNALNLNQPERLSEKTSVGNIKYRRSDSLSS